jgi:hypothetical protein
MLHPLRLCYYTTLPIRLLVGPPRFTFGLPRFLPSFVVIVQGLSYHGHDS